jgi:hypothetical protein
MAEQNVCNLVSNVALSAARGGEWIPNYDPANSELESAGREGARLELFERFKVRHRHKIASRTGLKPKVLREIHAPHRRGSAQTHLRSQSIRGSFCFRLETSSHG